MLKTAYQLGFQKALEDNGIDTEKVAQGFLRNLWGGLQQLGRGMGVARKAGAPLTQSLTRGMRSGWYMMNPAQQAALKGAGGVAALGGAYGLGRSATPPPPPPPPSSPWFQGMFGG